MPAADVRLLTARDFPDTVRLSHEAFGHRPGAEAPARPEPWPPAGVTSWGVGEDERLVAKLSVRDYRSFFDGAEVPTAGIAGVTVQAERRGAGLLSVLFDAALARARDDGAVVSTLFPTAPRIYRRFGYELVGGYRTVAVPIHQLAGLPVDEAVSVRRATAADAPAIRSAYTTWARTQQGPLVRTGPLFADDAELLGAFTGVSVAETGGEIIGYASWTRGEGYDGTGPIKVSDLVALSPAAADALWRTLGSFSAVAGEIHLDTSGDDVVRLALPAAAWRELSVNAYMLRVLDVPGALALRSVVPQLSGTLRFGVRGDRLGLIDGDYEVALAQGRLHVADGRGGPVLSPRGLALLYAGAQSAASLRLAGQLTGPEDQDGLLDAVFARAQFHIHDYF